MKLRDWCGECIDDPAGQRWLCPHARDPNYHKPILEERVDAPSPGVSPRQAQVEAFLAYEKIRERQAADKRACEVLGHIWTDESPMCVRCGEAAGDPYEDDGEAAGDPYEDDIPF